MSLSLSLSLSLSFSLNISPLPLPLSISLSIRPEWEVRHAKNLEKTKQKRKATADAEEKALDSTLPSFEAGKLLKLTGLKETSREGLKEAFSAVGFPVAYADYSIGQDDGIVRFDEAVAAEAKKAFEEQDAVKIGESSPVLSVVEGEEEEEYWKNMTERMKQARRKYKKGKRN